jgi:hypothetical protein
MNAGTQQSTISSPYDFKLLINNLNFYIQYIKYVDDTTAVSVSTDLDDPSLQHAADSLYLRSSLNVMVVNENNTKEMMVNFGRNYDVNCILTVCNNGKHIERIQTFKLLGNY